MISPVLANLFLHYVFDDFMEKEFPKIPWARYADDGVAHCVWLKQAKYLKRRLEQSFRDYGLELNLEKTRIVYCKDDDRRGKHEYTSFDFFGYTFRPRHAKNRYGKFFTNFLSAISEKAKKSIRKEVRGWKIERFHYVLKSGCKIEEKQARSYETLKKLTLLYSVIALSILNLTYMGQLCPELPTKLFLEEWEWKVLYRAARKTKDSPDGIYTIQDVLYDLAALSGIKGAPSDGIP